MSSALTDAATTTTTTTSDNNGKQDAAQSQPQSQATQPSQEDEKETLNTTNTSNETDEKKSDGNNGGDNGSSFLSCGVLPFAEAKEFSLKEEDVTKYGTPSTWSNCDATTFEVRKGPNYNPKKKQKAPSGNNLYNVFAIDTYTSPLKIHKLSQFVDLTSKIDDLTKNMPKYDYDKYPLPPVIIINFMVPNYAPNSYFGTQTSDGEGFALILYAAMTDDLRQELEKLNKGEIKKEDLDPSIRLLSRFIRAAEVRSELESLEKSGSKPTKKVVNGVYEKYGMSKKEVEDLLGRFKIIVRLMNYSKTQLPYAMTPIVTKYNGKPFLARTSSSFYHEPGKYFAIDVDAHVFGRISRNSLNYVRPVMDTLIYDGGFVIEGRSNDELPERILCCARINKVGPKATKPLPNDLIKQYLKRKENETHTSREFDVNVQSKSMVQLQTNNIAEKPDAASQTVPLIDKEKAAAAAEPEDK